MNYIDVILLILLIAAFAFGWKFRGIYIAVIFIAFFTGVITANLSYPGFSAVLRFIDNESKRLLLSYTITFLLGSGVIIFAGITTAKFFDFFKLTFIDRAIGAAFLIFLVLVPTYFFLIFLDKSVGMTVLNYHDAIQDSLIFPFLEKYVINLIHLPAMKHLSLIETILQ